MRSVCYAITAFISDNIGTARVFTICGCFHDVFCCIVVSVARKATRDFGDVSCWRVVVNNQRYRSLRLDGARASAWHRAHHARANTTAALRGSIRALPVDGTRLADNLRVFATNDGWRLA